MTMPSVVELRWCFSIIENDWIWNPPRPKKDNTEQATTLQPQKNNMFILWRLRVQNEHLAEDANSHPVALSDIMKA